MATSKKTQNKTDSKRDNTGEFIGQLSVTQMCAPCMKSNISKSASYCCKDCDEFLCDTCQHPHCVYKPGKHNIVIIQDMSDLKGLDRCQEHSEEVKFYCQDHSKLCCTTCAILHQKCHQLDEIDRLSQRNPTDLHALKPTLLKLESDADSILADCKKPDNNVSRSISNMSSEIDTMKDRIIRLFDAAKKNFISEANALKSEKMSRRQDCCLQLKVEINQMMSLYSAIEENGRPQQKYIVSKRLEEKQKIVQAEQNTPIITIPRELTALLEMGNNFVKQFCHETVTVETSRIKLSSQPEPFTLELIVSVVLYKTGDDQREPLLTGLDFLSDGRLVAVDKSNMKCIILNERLQRIRVPYKFNSAPNSVVCLPDDALCVTCEGKVVCLLSVSTDNTIKLTREIKTSCVFASICCMSSSLMAVTTSRTFEGDIHPTKQISMDGVESDFNLLLPKKTSELEKMSCTYVQSKNTLVLTSALSNTVHIYDNVKGTYIKVTNKNIQAPKSICVGPGDTVLMCCKNDNPIVHLTVDGAILGTYPVDLKYPRSICVSKDDTRLAVSNCILDSLRYEERGGYGGSLRPTDRPVPLHNKLQVYKILPAMS